MLFPSHLERSLFLSVPHPIGASVRIPITFLYSCIALEPQDARRLATIFFCDSLNLVKYVLVINCHRYYTRVLKHSTESDGLLLRNAGP